MSVVLSSGGSWTRQERNWPSRAQKARLDSDKEDAGSLKAARPVPRQTLTSQPRGAGAGRHTVLLVGPSPRAQQFRRGSGGSWAGLQPSQLPSWPWTLNWPLSKEAGREGTMSAGSPG